MNPFRTERYYRELSEDSLCSCAYCRNYDREIKEAYPVLSEYLSAMGIDIEKPFESMPLEPYEGTIEYIAVQYIVMGTASDFRSADVSGVHIDLADSHPLTEMEEEHFVIELSSIQLRWAM
ncbi:MAG: hypothetical protein ACSW8F_02825 [bacterium]